MKKGTFKTIILLVGLLFINIEVAQAGLINRFKVYIRHEFSDYQILYICLGLSLFTFLSYVIFTPVSIGKQKWGLLSYYSYNPSQRNYQNKRLLVKKISDILKNEGFPDQLHP